MARHLQLSATALLLVLTACGEANYVAGKIDGTLGREKQEEAWSAADNPAIFSAGLEFSLSALPLSGESRTIPWAGNYWPTYQDNINYEWAGTPSPAEKYEQAFRPDLYVEDWVSAYHGIDSQGGPLNCTSDNQCESGSACAKRFQGQTYGRCIPTWFGICHAWAPAAILMPEPRRAVVRNGVEFKIQDIKALLSLVFDKTNIKFVSLRCNTDNIPVDALGRPVQGSCRDTNPGTYHILLANYLGKMRQSFVEDRTIGAEVWNQPLRSYEVLQQRYVSAKEANRLLGLGATTWSDARWVPPTEEWVQYGPFPVTAGESFRAALAATQDADLYVRFNQPPEFGIIDGQCSPRLTTGNEICDYATVPQGATSAYVWVRTFANEAYMWLDVTATDNVPTSYGYNPQAVSFVYVQNHVKYIGESPANVDGHLASTIDKYTKSDFYEYILELDGAGKIIGGEWVGASKTNHPDFVWLPLSSAVTSVAGGAITYAQVKSLLDESVEGLDGSDQAQEVVKTASLNAGDFHIYGPFNAAAGTPVSVEMTGTGDADLYARAGSQPTLTHFDCRPYFDGSDEACVLSGPGGVYVAVHGYTAADYRLVVRYTPSTGNTPIPNPPASIEHLNVDGSVVRNEMKLYTLEVPAGRRIGIAMTAPNDVDLYIQMNVAPTAEAYFRRGYTDSGNESLEITPVSNGTLYIGVHGYWASTYNLQTWTIE